MDEFQTAGFDEETCVQLRKIVEDTGIEPSCIINLVRQYQPDTHPLSEYAQLGIRWDIFKQRLREEFEKTKVYKFMIWLADRLEAWLNKKRGG